MKCLFAIALSLASSGAMACPAGYYTNVDGYCVQRPTYYPPPAYVPPAYVPPVYLTPIPPVYVTPVPPVHIPPPSAQCNDGTYSYSQHRSGTCSHHGGIAP